MPNDNDSDDDQVQGTNESRMVVGTQRSGNGVHSPPIQPILPSRQEGGRPAIHPLHVKQESIPMWVVLTSAKRPFQTRLCVYPSIIP